jgi:hypothetical protein
MCEVRIACPDFTRPSTDCRYNDVPQFFLGRCFVVEQNREVEQAVSALTTEILKLSPLEGDALQALSVTIENAITRLAVAILAQSNQTQEASLEEAMEEVLPAT